MPKTDLYLENPLMNGAGTLGFSPDLKGPVDLTRFGAFITNPISLGARTPTKGTRYIPFSGGFLIHTGYPNPGLKAIIRTHARRWARSQLPIIVHILAQDAPTVGRMIQKLEGLEGLIGVELGLPLETDPDLAYQMTLAAVGELALIVRLPFEQVSVTGPNWALVEAVQQAGANAISLSPPRGRLPDPRGSLVTGRLYGPALFPQALATLTQLANSNLPIIASGGIYKMADVDVMLEVGASAVQLDATLWSMRFSGRETESRISLT